MIEPASSRRQALELHVEGVVQGVGFRPFVHRLAMRHRLAGWVRNESGAVRIEIEGPPDRLSAFVSELETEAPPLTRIDSLDVSTARPGLGDGFEIISSAEVPEGRLPISPDVATCPSCERELLDDRDRRFGYPFITCTDCGPRYTVIEAMPYDRERTSMRSFTQCEVCRHEYETPVDRRYHSETNSCAACGPSLRLLATRASADRDRVGGTGADGGPIAGGSGEVLAAAAAALRDGRIAAIRGLGGFHLAVDATDDAAVRRLRRRKSREAKPLAVMVADVEEAARIAVLGREEERLLRSHERPVVLLRARPGNGLAPSVAPGLDTIGVMTPYTPLHHVLLRQVRRPLVMTSGNVSDEPIAIGNAEARHRLGEIADLMVAHDREIVSRYDDSVVRVVANQPVFMRRARGYAPLPVMLPTATPRPLLAVGPHLKNTFALVHDRSAYVSQHIGDLENLETLSHFRDTLHRYQLLFRVDPEVAVRDLHPGYLSTRVAEELGLERVIAVQHHHAHIAAVAAEHGITDPVVGLAFDGTGYGDDGKVWGAETLVADLTDYRRVGRLRYAPLPGGDLAIRHPWRVALGYLSLAPELAAAFRLAIDGVSHRELAVAERQVSHRLNSPLASSMGRLFDAAAAVLGTRRNSHYEGQAAMELEALAGDRDAEPLPFPIRPGRNGCRELDPLPLLAALGELATRGEEPPELAARFHESVAAASSRLAAEACEESGVSVVALGGGVFQNARLMTSVRRRLETRGLRVLVPRQLSPNDGAISYGQAAVAAAVLRAEMSL